MNALEAIANSMAIEGQTTRPALCLMSAFLEHARKLRGRANGLVEFGTYRGRVSSLLSQLMLEDDVLHLVDVADYLEHDRLKALGCRYQFHRIASERWNVKAAHKGLFWFSHHDASHAFSNVSHELTLIAKCTSSAAVVVLDDFNDPYNQVRAAYYHQRYLKRNPLELLIMGFGKAVLVHTEVFAEYERFILNALQVRLRELDCDTTIFRTDACSESRAFSIAKKKLATDPNRYGLNVWGERFYQPSRE